MQAYINMYNRHVTDANLKNQNLIYSLLQAPSQLEWKGKFWFLHPLSCWEMHFSKPGKYSIINKSTTFATFFYPYLKPQFFTLFLYESQQQQQKISEFFFSAKPEFW